MNVFISYRRVDTVVYARLVRDGLERRLGDQGGVFMDTGSIRVGEDWRLAIDRALHDADTVVVMIGPRWLTVQDAASGMRRIDKEDDWVRNEIRHALDGGKRVVPVIVGGAPWPEADILPEAIRGLHRPQPVVIDDARLEADLDRCLAEITEGRPAPSDADDQLDEYAAIRLTDDELDDALDELGSEWTLLRRPDAAGLEGERVDIVREFEFAEFSDVIRFMTECVAYIDEANHHPRWENSYRSLKVWLSTWDIGHRPTRLDIELARFLEDRFAGGPLPSGPAHLFRWGPFQIGEDQVEDVAWSADGRLIAACSRDGAVVVVDHGTAEEVLRAELGPEVAIGSVAWDGERGLVVAGRQVVLAWQLSGGGRSDMHGPARFVDASWSPDGRHVAAVSTSELRIWPTPGDPHHKRISMGADRPIHALSWSEPHAVLVGGGRGLVQVRLDPSTLAPTATDSLRDPCGEITALLAAGGEILVGARDGLVARFSDGTWSEVGRHERAVVGVARLADGRVASRDRRGDLRVWSRGDADAPSWSRPADLQRRGSRCGLAAHPEAALLALPDQQTEGVVVVQVEGA